MNRRVTVCLLLFYVAHYFATDVFADELINGSHDRIDLYDDTVIINHGIINSIYTNDYNLIISNYNTIYNVYNSGTAYVNQQISDNEALHKINVIGDNFSVNINNLNQVDLTQLKDIVSGADKTIVINDSSIIINNFADWRNWNQNVSLTGTNTLYIQNPETIISGELLNFVHDNGTKVVLLDSEKLYKAAIRYESGVSFIDITKETDVSKLFDDERNSILADLRASVYNNSLIMLLNNSNSIQEIERILQLSYRFNPSVLMRPIDTLNQFGLIDFLNNYDTIYGGFSGFYVFADTTNAFGLDFNVAGKYEDWYVGTGFNLGRFYYKNDLNDFDGFAYGANIKIKKYIDDFWLHGMVGFRMANFKTDTMYYNNHIKQNPVGYSGYGALDLGYDYALSSDVIFAPFIGGTTTLSWIMKKSDKDVTGRAGGNIKYSFGTDDIKYNCSGLFGISVDGDLFGKTEFGFMSNQDGAGLSVGFDVIKNDDDMYYKINLQGKILF